MARTGDASFSMINSAEATSDMGHKVGMLPGDLIILADKGERKGKG